ncbi:MAG TPA: colicin V production CvpA, partial [Gammaproteobacteria bacterium]|nr:colicin V production CvpA [Gammaproteobacteria bacterium]
MEMTPVDFLIVGVVFVSAAISWLRGFTKEAISLLSWLL